MRAYRRHSPLLRTALLVLLVLGMVVSPVLAAVGELHGIEHAALEQAALAHADSGHVATASSGGAQDHAHAPAAEHPGHHDDGVDPDHATGGHGLMHQAGTASVTLPEPAALDIAMQSASDRRLPEVDRFHLPGDSPSLPFRPPIA